MVSGERYADLISMVYGTIWTAFRSLISNCIQYLEIVLSGTGI